IAQTWAEPTDLWADQTDVDEVASDAYETSTGEAVALRRPAPWGDGDREVGAGADEAPAAGRSEVICHQSAERADVAEQIDALGGLVTSSAGRVVRFVLNRADVDAVAVLPGVAGVSAAKTQTLRCDLARRIVGLENDDVSPEMLPFDGGGELIGVADTGIDTDHPDFVGKRVTV